MEIEKISSEESEMIGDLYDAMGQDNWNKAKDLVGITGHIYKSKDKNEVIKMKREEVAKIRRELQKTERALSLAEKPKQESNKNLGPVELPDKEKYLNERPASADVPNVIHLPKKQKRTENKW